MRKIDPHKVKVPDEIRYKKIGSEIAKIETDSAFVPDGEIYRGEIKKNGVIEKRTVLALKSKYDNKCGYCESFEYDPRVEHHRPKGFVTTGAKNNLGYYWLAYEWTNMVAACNTCNNRPFKGTNFPLEDITKRNTLPPLVAGKLDLEKLRYSHAYNTNELPKILHPEYVDDFREHFTFNRFGEIDHLSELGKQSIITYGLDRKTLNASRKLIYDNYYAQLERVIRKKYRNTGKQLSDDDFEEEIGEIFGLILQSIADKESQPFTLFTETMILKFEHFFIEPFDPVIHQRLKEVYSRVLKVLLKTTS